MLLVRPPAANWIAIAMPPVPIRAPGKISASYAARNTFNYQILAARLLSACARGDSTCGSYPNLTMFDATAQGWTCFVTFAMQVLARRRSVRERTLFWPLMKRSSDCIRRITPGRMTACSHHTITPPSAAGTKSTSRRALLSLLLSQSSDL